MMITFTYYSDFLVFFYILTRLCNDEAIMISHFIGDWNCKPNLLSTVHCSTASYCARAR